MIDWWMVIVNGLWIFGLAVLLASFSYSRFMKSQKMQIDPSHHHDWITSFFHLGLLFFVLGITLASASWLERAVGGIGLVGVIYSYLHILRDLSSRNPGVILKL
ncbi:MAG: hypothetical protein M1281_18655 [Chloroflexi bacterium]|nr:hypothetical protein [Chloroflexota bacterium]